MYKIVIFIILSFILVGCDSNKYMKDNFGEGKYHVFIEEKTNKKYLVKHHAGTLYTVEPLSQVLDTNE